MKMKIEIETAIKTMIEKAVMAPAHEAMQFAQAALNFAHADATLETTRRENEKQK